MEFLRKLWQRIRKRYRPDNPPGVFTLDSENYALLERMCANTLQTPGELASELLNETFRNHAAQAENWQLWNRLSPREKEVAALICLGLTGRQIAARLHISPATVRTHADHILNKFGIPDRLTLRYMLADWDFKGWE